MEAAPSRGSCRYRGEPALSRDRHPAARRSASQRDDPRRDGGGQASVRFERGRVTGVIVPAYEIFVDLLDFDWKLVFVANRHARLAREMVAVGNPTENLDHAPHGIAMLVFATLDLMASPSLSIDDLSALRELVHAGQTLCELANMIATWQREIPRSRFRQPHLHDGPGPRRVQPEGARGASAADDCLADPRRGPGRTADGRVACAPSAPRRPRREFTGSTRDHCWRATTRCSG